MDAKKQYPGFNDDSADNDNDLRNDLDADTNRDTDVNNSTDIEDLKFNEDADSFEYDVDSEDPDYDHPDPYNTSSKFGNDIDSTYDEANPYAVDEYIPNENLEKDVDNLGMHIDSGRITEVDPVDEAISRTPEDDRDDLDEEGYPKNDGEYLK
ncbi:hypothetical protein IM792_06200 [Mucilaginibacter sp. JRF]|uniref:hypothetical protein n=1 Tax=Mucilaginibacter sp. JRF TaxID=2780088 RepID=UPI00188168AC|nr:hypothetical protein [Mucilaginibacter sp. JRF]MBE9584034.1 hypothetical protein [Mucilaginibacter sp. JRF]